MQHYFPAKHSAVDVPLADYRLAVIATFPELAEAAFSLLGSGWHSDAVEADGWVFKFPKSEEALAALVKEEAVLAIVRPRVAIAVPELKLVGKSRRFSRHRKIPGKNLLSGGYAMLTAAEKDRLAADLALFYAQVHAMPKVLFGHGLVGAMPEWGPFDTLSERIHWLRRRPGLEQFAVDAIDRYAALPVDPCGEVYGFFDGHGWNMAFDFDARVLRGIFDFADSGFGPRHREFVYPSFVAWDLTRRIVRHYTALTGVKLDEERIALLTTVFRVDELIGAEEGKDLAMALDFLERWMAETAQ